MAKGLRDLDRSLDETIKLKKARSLKREPTTKQVRNNPIRQIKPGSSAINKRIGNTKINTRLGQTIPPRMAKPERNGNLIIKSKAPLKTHERANASNIIITKSTSVRTSSSSGGSFMIKRNMPIQKQPSRQQSQPQSQQSQPQQPQVQQPQVQRQQQQRRQPQPQQRQELQEIAQPMQTNRLSAPVQHQKNIVLICNLDPRATAEDVGEACSVFGPILSCDMLLDPMGRPLCEAEIEFLYPDSAEQCVSKLDNNYADGRILRAKLQNTPTLPVVPRYSSRTVVASARVSSNGFDNSMSAPLPPPQVFYQHNRIEYPKRY